LETEQPSLELRRCFQTQNIKLNVQIRKYDAEYVFTVTERP